MARLAGTDQKYPVPIGTANVFARWSEPETFAEYLQADGMPFLIEVVFRNEDDDKVIFGVWHYEPLYVDKAQQLGDRISFRLRERCYLPDFMEVVALLSERKWEARYV